MNFLNWAYNAPSKNQKPSSKNLSSRQEKPSFDLLVIVIQEILQTYSLSPLAIVLVAPPPQGKSLLLKTPCTSDSEPRGPRDGTCLEASALRTSCHGQRRCQASFQTREVPNSPNQFDAYELQQPNVAITTLWVLCWQACLGSDYHLSSWT